jgi:hypothetical protein
MLQDLGHVLGGDRGDRQARPFPRLAFGVHQVDVAPGSERLREVAVSISGILATGYPRGA